MQGFVSAIGDQSEIRMDVGAAEPVRASSRFLEFTSPISTSADGGAPIVSGEGSEEVADQWDEEEFEEFDETDPSPDASERE